MRVLVVDDEVRLAALIKRGPTTLSVNDLRLDPATHQAWRGDVELVLSAKEFSLLEFGYRLRLTAGP